MSRRSAFEESYQEVENGIRGILKEFTLWCGDNWQIDNNSLSDDEKYSEQYIAGWNAAITDGIVGALENFLEDMTP